MQRFKRPSNEKKFEKKKIIPLTDKEKETHENKKKCYICEKEFRTDKNNEKES